MKTSRIAGWAAVLVCLAQLASGSQLYFVANSHTSSAIYCFDLSVSNLTLLYQTNDYDGDWDCDITGLEADATSSKVFWNFHQYEVPPYYHSIMGMGLTGSAPQILIQLGQNVGTECVDVDEAAGRIYFGGHQIYSTDITGSGLQVVIPVGQWVSGLAVDPLHGKIYWTQWAQPSGIYQANLDGSGATQLVSCTTPVGIDVDIYGGKIYWVSSGVGPVPPPQKVWSANLDGTGQQLLTVVPDGQLASDLALDLTAGKIYWSSISTILPERILRANLDGTDLETVIQIPGKCFLGISVLSDPYCPYFHGIYEVVDDLASGGLGGLETADGDYVMAAGARVNGAVDTDVVLLKTDDQGHPKWGLRYVKSRNEEMHAICEVGGSNFVIAGSAETSSAGDRDVYVLKTGHGGNGLWASTFGTTYAIETGNSILSTSDGGSLISGMQRLGNGDCDAYLVKIKANGALQWARAYDWSNTFESVHGDYDEALAAVEIPPANGVKYIVTGRTGPNSKATDVLLMGVSETGVPMWSRAVGDGRDGGLRTDIGYSIVRHPDGGVAVAGVAGKDGLLLRATDNGDVLWANIIGLFGQEELHSLVVAPDGGLVMGGFSMRSFELGKSLDLSISGPGIPIPLISYRYWLVKTDSAGVIDWSRFYGDGLGRAEAYSLDNAAHGGYYLSGKLRADPSPGSVPYAVRTDSEGKVDFQNTNDPTCYQTVQPEVSPFRMPYSIKLQSRNEGIGRKVSANSQTLSLSEEIFCQGCTPNPMDAFMESIGKLLNSEAQKVDDLNIPGKIPAR